MSSRKYYGSVHIAGGFFKALYMLPAGQMPWDYGYVCITEKNLEVHRILRKTIYISLDSIASFVRSYGFIYIDLKTAPDGINTKKAITVAYAQLFWKNGPLVSALTTVGIPDITPIIKPRSILKEFALAGIITLSVFLILIVIALIFA